MGKAVAILIVLAGAARADLGFVVVDGETNGVGRAMRAWRDESPGGKWWPWGVAAWHDHTGRYVYFANHYKAGGMLLKRRPNGHYIDITPPDQSGSLHATAPRENRPYVFDVDNDGDQDVLHAGDESRDAVSLVNNGDGTWSYSRPLRVGDNYGRVGDINRDGLRDMVLVKKRFGQTSVRTAINDGGRAWRRSAWTEVPRPEGLPQAVHELLDKMESKKEAKGNRSAGPDYWHGDLDGDGDEDLVVTYWASYSHQPYIWSRICLRNGRGELEVADVGFHEDNAVVMPPFDADGDGDLDLLGQWGRTKAGLYLQESAGEFVPVKEGSAAEMAKIFGQKNAAYIYEYWSGDLDFDGDPDLLVGTKRRKAAYLYENQDGKFVRTLKIPHADGEPIGIDDLDGDGDLDIVAWQQGDPGAVKFYYNEANPSAPSDPEIESQASAQVARADSKPSRAAPAESGQTSATGRRASQPRRGQAPVPARSAQAPVPGRSADGGQVLTPETLSAASPFASGGSYRLTEGVYSPISIKGRNNVTVVAEAGVLVKGRGLHNHAVTVDGCKNIHLEGLNCTGGKAGIGLYRSKDVTVRKCRSFHNEQWGIFSSFVERLVLEENVCLNSEKQHGIYVSNSGDGHVIRGNVCVGNKLAGIQLNGDRYSGGDGVISRTLIEDNVCVDNRMAINADGLTDSVIRNNFLGGSVRLYKIDGGKATQRLSVVDNTIMVKGQERNGVHLRNGASNIAITANLIYLSGTGTRCISYTPGCSFVETANILASRRPLPVGGGKFGNTNQEAPNSVAVDIE